MAWEWKATGDSRHAQRAVEQLDRRLARLEERNAQLAARSRQTNRTMTSSTRRSESGYAKVAMTIGKVAAAMGVATIAARTLGRTIEENNRKAAEAKNENLSLAAAQESAAKNLTGVDRDTKRRLLTEVPTSIKARTGFADQAALTAAIGAGFSASGDVKATVDAVTAAARLNRFNPGGLQVDAAAALDIGRASGIRDAERNIGALLTAGSVSRVDDPRKLATSLGKIAESARAAAPRDAAAEAVKEGFAVFATLTKAGTDTTGDTASTSTIALLNKFETFFRDRDDPGTNQGRIHRLATDEKLREQFLRSSSFEIRYNLAVRELLTEGSALNKMYRDNIGAISFSKDVYDKQAADLADLTPQMALASVQSSVDAAKSDFLISQQQQALQAQIRETVNEALRLTRHTTFDVLADPVTGFFTDAGHQLMKDINSDFGFDSSSREHNKRLIGRLHSRLDSVAGFGRTPEDFARLPQEEREEAKMLLRMIELLESVNNKLGSLNDGVGEERARARDLSTRKKAVKSSSIEDRVFTDFPF